MRSQELAEANVARDQTGENSNNNFLDSHDTMSNNTSNNRQALTAICNPLGDDIPQPLKDKIGRGEFVEFGSLLDKTSYNPQQPLGDMVLSVNSDGQITFNQSKSPRRITSIHSWTNAFLVFTAIYLQSQPDRAQELLKYGHLIRTAASRFGNWGWRDYDTHFRRRQESHPQKSWAVIDGELWSLFVAVPSLTMNIGGQLKSFRGSAPGPKGSNNKSSRGGHSSGQQRPNVKTSSQGSQSNICYPFNNNGSCSRPNCRFKHMCSTCNKEGHGASKCNNR